MSLPVGENRYSLTYDSDGNITPDVHLKKNVGYNSVYELARIIDLVSDSQYDHIVFVGNVKYSNILQSYEGEEGEDTELVLGYITNPNPSLYDAYLTAKTRYGTPSETNRIAVVILSSVIEETATIGLNSKYVDIISLGQSHLIGKTAGTPVFDMCGDCRGAKIQGLTITSNRAPIMEISHTPFDGSFSFVGCSFYSTPKTFDPNNYSNYAQFVFGIGGNGNLDFDQCHFYPSNVVFKSLRNYDVQPNPVDFQSEELKKKSAYEYDVVVRNSTIHCRGTLRVVLLQKYFTLKLYNSVIEMTNQNCFLFTNGSGSTSGTLARLLSNRLTITAPSQGEYFYFNGTNVSLSNTLTTIDGSLPVESFYLDVFDVASEADTMIEVFNASSKITGRLCNVVLNSGVRRYKETGFHGVNGVFNVAFNIRALNSTLEELMVSRFDGILRMRAFEFLPTVRISNVSSYENPRSIYYTTTGDIPLISSTGCAAPTLVNCNIYGRLYEPYTMSDKNDLLSSELLLNRYFKNSDKNLEIIVKSIEEGSGLDDKINKISLGFFAGSVYGGSSCGIYRCASVNDPLRQCVIKNHSFFKREYNAYDKNLGEPRDVFGKTYWPDIVLADKYLNVDETDEDRRYPSSFAPVMIQGCTSDGVLRIESGDDPNAGFGINKSSSNRYVMVTNCTFTSRLEVNDVNVNQGILPNVGGDPNEFGDNRGRVLLSSVSVIQFYSPDGTAEAPRIIQYNSWGFTFDPADSSVSNYSIDSRW